MINNIIQIKKSCKNIILFNIFIIIFNLIPILILYYLVYLLNNIWNKLNNIDIIYIIIFNIVSLIFNIYQLYFYYINHNKYIILLNQISLNIKTIFINYCIFIKIIPVDIKRDNTNFDTVIDIYDSDNDSNLNDSNSNDSNLNNDKIYSNDYNIKINQVNYIKELLNLYISFLYYTFLKNNNEKQISFTEFYKIDNFINLEIKKIYHNININTEIFILQHLYTLILKKINYNNNNKVINDTNYIFLYNNINTVYSLSIKLYYKIITNNKFRNNIYLYYYLIFIINLLNNIIYSVNRYEYTILYFILYYYLIFSIKNIIVTNYDIFKLNKQEYLNKHLINILDEIFINYHFMINNINYKL